MATPRTLRTTSSFVCQACRCRAAPLSQPKRLFTSSSSTRANEPPPSPVPETQGRAAPRPMGNLVTQLSHSTARKKPSYLEALDGRGDNSLLPSFADPEEQHGPHRLYVYSHKHNTHLTLVQSPRPAHLTAGSGVTSTSNKTGTTKMVDVLLSLSAGNIGFKKAGRSSFDAAFQLTAYFLKQIQERGMLRDIQQLEVVLRGFGAGREAVPKVILGPEGRNIRGKIIAVLDGTRIKHGGTRAPKPRRLG